APRSPAARLCGPTNMPAPNDLSILPDGSNWKIGLTLALAPPHVVPPAPELPHRSVTQIVPSGAPSIPISGHPAAGRNPRRARTGWADRFERRAERPSAASLDTDPMERLAADRGGLPAESAAQRPG